MNLNFIQNSISQPLQRLLIAINAQGNAIILASEGEIIEELRAYNGDFDIEFLGLPDGEKCGFFLWEGTVHFFSDGEEKWNGNWKYADDDVIQYWRFSTKGTFGELLPIIDSVEKAAQHLEITEVLPQLIEVTKKIFGVEPHLTFETYPIALTLDVTCGHIRQMTEWYQEANKLIPDFPSGVAKLLHIHLNIM